MDQMDIREVVKRLCFKFNTCFEIDEKSFTHEYKVIRTTINSASEAYVLVDELGRIQSTKFVLYCARSKLLKYVYHAKWVCQHSAYRKSQNSKRDYKCNSFIDILIKKVNRGTLKNDPFLRRSNPLQCVIKLSLVHTHEKDDPERLRMNRVPAGIKAQFIEYFKSGMSVIEARKFHELKIIAEGGASLLPNTWYNPSTRQAYHMYYKWKDGKKGFVHEPFEKIVEKSQAYESAGVTVNFNDNHPWSILIVTPPMKRAQALPSSREVIFVDSNVTGENSICVVTMLMTATKAGAVPIAVLLHESPTAKSFYMAFALLLETFPTCFGGDKAPEAFVTNDLQAQIVAVKSMFDSQQLLSDFHVAHAEWRWLMSMKSGVEVDDCKGVLELFDAVMYADDEHKLFDAKFDILSLRHQYPAFVTRFENFFERRKEWVLFYRISTFTENKDLYKFCEANMRILKDVIISRTKALKLTGLVEFCIYLFDSYLSGYLIDLAYDQILPQGVLYYVLSTKMTAASASDVLQVDEGMYLVPSSSHNQKYLVDTKLGYCTCLESKSGAFCQHQGFLMDKSKLHFPEAPVLCPEDCYMLVRLALGDKTPENLSPQDFCAKEGNESDDESSVTDLDDEVGIDLDHSESMESSLHTVKSATEEEKAALLAEINRLLQFDIEKSNLTRLTDNLSTIVTSQQLDQTLTCMTSTLSAKEKIYINRVITLRYS